MTRAVQKLTTKDNPYASTTKVNPEGFPTFQRSDREAYLQVLMTNTLTGSFYVKEKKLLEDALALHKQFSEEDPEFMVRAIIYARNKGSMRLQPIVGLVYLAKANLPLFHNAFTKVIKTPGDLSDFVEIMRGGLISRGMGRSVKRAINIWLNNLTEYHAIKYATGGQGYSLRDIIRLTHPNPKDDKQNALFKWLVRPDELGPDLGELPQVEDFVHLKRSAQEEDQGVAQILIANSRLPYEVVTGVIKPNVETWRVLMKQMPYFALLRHLNTLQRAGVFSDQSSVLYVADRLRDATALRKSRVLPFRLYMAYQMFSPNSGAERLISDALSEALELTFSNMPEMGGTICIAPDVSGSMGGRISEKSQTRYVDISGLFTAAILKSNPTATVLPFEGRIVPLKLSGRDSAMSTIATIASVRGGSTAVSAPISYLLEEGIPVDTFIGITDNVEWVQDSYGNTGFLPTWKEYKRKVAPKAKAFLITISPGRFAVAPPSVADINYIYGWSDAVVKHIQMSSGDASAQVNAVAAMEL